MPTPRLSDARRAAPAAIILLAAMLLVVGFGVGGANERSLASQASGWSGLAGGTRLSSDAQRAVLAQRMIVVLKTPSLAQRVAASGGFATQRQEHEWTRIAIASQKQLLAEMASHGIQIRADFSFARVLNGFSAPLDAPAVALLERQSDVAGVYPVRVAYPASLSSQLLGSKGLAVGAGSLPSVLLPGYDGRGVTVALLDTGVDGAHPYLRGRILPGVNIVDPEVRGGAPAVADPAEPSRLEAHGTEMAGLLVGAGGPGGISGVSTGASVLPVRVAGWQRTLAGSWGVFARTDQLIAGLERAVDPNLDGDAHDAARIALLGVAAPYAAFADSPEARAVKGALDLDTLVVAPAGNDGPGGPGYGSIAGPGGAPDALTVGAADLRTEAEDVPVAVRTGLRLLLDKRLPLAGAVVSATPLELELASPKAQDADAQEPKLGAFFNHGVSLVAGDATFVRAGNDPALAIEDAVQAGARAVVVYGTELPAGGLGLDEDVDVPVVSVPTRVARLVLAALSAHRSAVVSIGVPHTAANGSAMQVAPFSSRGLAYDGRVKPDLTAPGVVLATAEPGRNDDGSPRYGTVNGTSGAAAVVAGAAALLAQLRPNLSAEDLRSLLAGTADPLADTSDTAEGGGLVDLGAAASTELAAWPTTLAFGRAQGDGWHSTQRLTVHNVSSRKFRVRIRSVGQGGLAIRAFPRQVRLKPGGSTTVRLVARLRGVPPGGGSAEGAVILQPRGSGAVRVPWAITFGTSTPSLLAAVALSASAFKPSDALPAVLSLQAGSLTQDPSGTQVQPVDRLDIELWRGSERLGLLASLRDLLPGQYQYAITGRDPDGNVLPSGPYRIRLVAFPTVGGPPTRTTVRFRIK
jgi:subtilisin family serine protease